MRILHCICAMAALSAATARAQAPPAVSTSGYTVFFRGAPAGREDISTRTDGTGTVITSQGRILAPASIVMRRVEIRYGPEGALERFDFEGSVNGSDVELHTVLQDGSAVTQGEQNGQPVSLTHTVSPDATLVANGIYAGFAALPRVLARSTAGADIPVFLVPSAQVDVRIAAIEADRMQTGTTLFDVRRYDLLLADPGGQIPISLTTSLDGALLRVSIPTQAIEVVRNDLAGAASRTEVFSNPGDQAVVIPAAGFNIGATLTLPAGTPSAAPADAARGDDEARRLPAVVLVAGTRAPDRDVLLTGVPSMAEIAGALADAGYASVRYDRRGSGQSGGRAESAGLADYADDVRTVVRWLGSRKDIDSRRIAVVGHGEGSWTALLAASKENRVAAVASLAGPGTTGSELVLEQQRDQLERMQMAEADRTARVALQQRIHEAVLSGKGWDQLAPEIRKQADTAWFQSLLAFDPAKVLRDVDTPLLIVHGALDHEIPVAHAEQLADLARKGDPSSVDLVIVRGVNHLLIPAFTGEVAEYATLTDRHVSKDVTSALAGWLERVLPARKG